MLAGRHGEAVGLLTGTFEPGEMRRATGEGADKTNHTPGTHNGLSGETDPRGRGRERGEEWSGVMAARSQALLGGVRGERTAAGIYVFFI